jgi:23S rRNA pseudoU1915 N3-methylase RlmH
LAQFYKWTDQQIEEMDYSLVMDYYNSMEVIEARNQLSAIQSSSFANYKQNVQERIIKDLNKVINEGQKRQSGKEVSTDEFASLLARGMNG